MHMRKRGLLLLVLFFAALFMTFDSHRVLAAGGSLNVSASKDSLKAGDSVTLTVTVNTDGQPINTAEGKVKYSSDQLDFVSITGATSSSGSIVKTWVTYPDDAGGIISFAGGIPTPGYNGSSGQLFKINFTAKSEGAARVTFESGSFYLNNAESTRVYPSFQNSLITVSAGSSGSANTTPTKSTGTTPTPSNTATKTSTTPKPGTTGTTKTGQGSGSTGASEPTPTPSAEPTIVTRQDSSGNKEIFKVNNELKAPEVIDFTKMLKKTDLFHVKGKTGYPNHDVVLVIQKNETESDTYMTTTDDQGGFEYTAAQPWEVGKYTFWTEVVDQDGFHSTPSEKKHFEITENLLQKAQRYSTTLIILLILTGIVGNYTFHRMLREKRKKELEKQRAEIEKRRDQLTAEEYLKANGGQIESTPSAP